MSREPASSLPALLGLERDTVERVANRTEQWAKSLERSLKLDAASAPGGKSPGDDDRRRREIASLFAIAGSYRLLLDAREAASALRAAARHLNAVGSSYAHPVAVCSGDPTTSWLFAADESNGQSTAGDRAALMVRIGWIEVSQSELSAEARQALLAHLEQATLDAPTAVGRLRIPLAASAQVLRSVDDMLHESSGIGPLASSVREFLVRAHDVTAQAMHDDFHWRNLYSSVLPVEPEAAALSAVVMAAAERRDRANELMERIKLPDQAKSPLFVGDAIARSARG